MIKMITIFSLSLVVFSANKLNIKEVLEFKGVESSKFQLINALEVELNKFKNIDKLIEKHQKRLDASEAGLSRFYRSNLIGYGGLRISSKRIDSETIEVKFSDFQFKVSYKNGKLFVDDKVVEFRSLSKMTASQRMIWWSKTNRKEKSVKKLESLFLPRAYASPTVKEILIDLTAFQLVEHVYNLNYIKGLDELNKLTDLFPQCKSQILYAGLCSLLVNEFLSQSGIDPTTGGEIPTDKIPKNATQSSEIYFLSGLMRHQFNESKWLIKGRASRDGRNHSLCSNEITKSDDRDNLPKWRSLLASHNPERFYKQCKVMSEIIDDDLESTTEYSIKHQDSDGFREISTGGK